MLLIISCHILQYYHLELCYYLNVGVQVFFVISGFLYGTKEITSPMDFVKKNFKKILVPYYIFLFLVIAVYSISCPEKLSVKTLLGSIFRAGTLSGLGHLWFVGYILFCYLITPYLYWFRKSIPYNASFKKVITIYLGTFLILQLLGFAFRSYFTPPFIGCYLIGFFLSDMKCRFGMRPMDILLPVMMTLAILSNTLDIYIKYVQGIEFEGIHQIMFSEYSHYAHLFLGVALFLAMFKLFSESKYTTLLILSDKCSYHIYIVHQLFILSPFTLMAVTPIPMVSIFLVLLAILLSGSMLYVVSEKLMTNAHLIKNSIF